MRIKTSLHSDRGDMWHVGERAGLTDEDMLDTFNRALYSVAFELDVDETTGEATIVSVNGMALVEPGIVHVAARRAADLAVKQEREYLLKEASHELTNPDAGSVLHDLLRDRIEHDDVVDVTKLVDHAVEAERKRLGKLLRRDIDEYDKDHDDNGFACAVEGLASALEEGLDPEAPVEEHDR